MVTKGLLNIRRLAAVVFLLLPGLLGGGGIVRAEPVMLVGTLVQVNEPEQELIVQLHAPAPLSGYHGRGYPGYPEQQHTLLRVRLQDWEDSEGALQRLRHMNMHRPVRIWGQRDAEAADLFWATMVLGGRGGAQGDPTGVRSRLGRGCPLPAGGAVEDDDASSPPGHGRGGYGGGRGGGRGRGGR